MKTSSTQKINFVPKGWGFEKWIHNSELYCGKLLYFVKDRKCSWHYHKLKFQMVYILKGSVEFEYKGEGTFTLNAGDVVYQPPEIHHREIKHSDDLELIEITSPAEFETISLNKS